MNVVSVMAHQDDELMCLGTMLKMKARGDNLHFICLTGGEMGMVHQPEIELEEASEYRRKEMEALTAAAGGSYQCLGYEDEFLFDSKEVRIALINALRKTKAEVIFTHYPVDYNLDHMSVNRLVRQCAMQMAFPMIHTETPPVDCFPAVFLVEPADGFEFEPSHWVNIDEVVNEKMRLSKFHQSQDEAFKAAFGKAYGIEAWSGKISAFRGRQCGCGHAEAFVPMRARGFVKGYSVLP